MKKMEILPLLSGGESSPMIDRLPAFNRRSDAIAYGSPYQKAAALIDLDEGGGTGIPEEILDNHVTFAEAAKLYFIFTRFDWIWSLNNFALLYLNFLEKPLWCGQNLAISCNNREYYFLGQLPYLNGSGSLIYEGITLVILAAHVIFPVSYEGFNLYWKNHLNKVKIIFLLILATDVFIYALYLSPVALYSLTFRIAPYIRVVFFTLNIRVLREALLVLAGTIATFVNVVDFYFCCSSWLAYVIFENTDQGRKVFTSYGATMYQMFILFTTANNPDVWIPAYKASRWYSLFFILYVLLGVHFVTNLILAVVNDSFKGQLVKQVAAKDHMRNKILEKAFDLIDIQKVKFLNRDQCSHLFREIGRYRTLPDISEEDFGLIFHELDGKYPNGKICLEEFTDICNVIARTFQKEDSLPWLEKFSFYRAPLSQNLKTFIRGPMFEYSVIFVLILNVVTVVVETTFDIEGNSRQKFWEQVEFVFGWLYFLEMVLKVYSYGFENYWRDGQNRFDFIMTVVIVVFETTTIVSPGLLFLTNGEWIRYLLIARMLRLIRLLLFVRSYRAFVATFLNLIPSLMPYLGTIFCMLCIYCSLGVQIFGGLVNAGNPRLAETGLADNDYLVFNFNDYPSGMVTLFNLLVTVNWQAWMQSYKELTDSVWSYAYFVSFYLVAVLLLLDLVVAYVLDSFLARSMEIKEADKYNDGDNISERNKARRRYANMKTPAPRGEHGLGRSG